MKTHRNLVMVILAITILLSVCITTAYADDGDNRIGVTFSNGTLHVGVEGQPQDEVSNSISVVIGKYKGIAATIMGLCVITSLIALVFNITKLGASGSNDRVRREAIIAIAFSALSITLFGGGTIAVGIFWNALN